MSRTSVVTHRLRDMGFEVINPAEAFFRRTDLPRPFYLRNDIESILKANAFIQMPGWEDSKGAVLERQIAVELGLPIWDLPGDF